MGRAPRKRLTSLPARVLSYNGTRITLDEFDHLVKTNRNVTSVVILNGRRYGK